MFSRSPVDRDEHQPITIIFVRRITHPHQPATTTMGLFLLSSMVSRVVVLCCYATLTLDLVGTVSGFQSFAFSFTGYRSANEDPASIVQRNKWQKIGTTSFLFSVSNQNDRDDNIDYPSSSLPTSYRNLGVVLCSSRDVMLPGERRTISIQRPNKEILFRGEEEGDGKMFMAIGYTYDGSSFEVIQDGSNGHDDYPYSCDEEDFNIMHIATLCQVCQPNEFQEDCITLRLQAIGRIRLSHFVKQLDQTCYQFDCEILKDEDEGCLDTVNDNSRLGNGSLSNFQQAYMLVENIEMLLRKISRTERKRADNVADNLWEHYQRAMQQTSANTAQSTTNREFAGISPFETKQKKHYAESVGWAAFTAIKQWKMTVTKNTNTREESVDAELNYCFYRIRALDWDNLLERLKLAQYMLREMELRLQGKNLYNDSLLSHELTTDGEEDDDDGSTRLMNGQPTDDTIFRDDGSFQ